MRKGQKVVEKSMSQQELDAKFVFYSLKEPFGLIKGGYDIPSQMISSAYNLFVVNRETVVSEIMNLVASDNYIIEYTKIAYKLGLRAEWFPITDNRSQEIIKLRLYLSVYFAVAVSIARNSRFEPWVAELLNECSQLASASEQAMKKYEALCEVVQPEYRYINQGGKINEWVCV